VVIGSRRKHLGLDSSNVSRATNAMSKILVAASNNRADTAAFTLAYPDFTIKIVAVHDGQVLHKGAAGSGGDFGPTPLLMFQTNQAVLVGYAT
jgi:hypothetical protein